MTQSCLTMCNNCTKNIINIYRHTRAHTYKIVSDIRASVCTDEIFTKTCLNFCSETRSH